MNIGLFYKWWLSYSIMPLLQVTVKRESYKKKKKAGLSLFIHPVVHPRFFVQQDVVVIWLEVAAFEKNKHGSGKWRSMCHLKLNRPRRNTNQGKAQWAAERGGHQGCRQMLETVQGQAGIDPARWECWRRREAPEVWCKGSFLAPDTKNDWVQWFHTPFHKSLLVTDHVVYSLWVI